MGVAKPLPTEPAQPINFYICGGLALTDGNRLVTSSHLPGKLGRVALAILALNHLRPVSNVELADLLWAGDPPDAWRVSLRATMSRARSALQRRLNPANHVIGGDGWYQLALPIGSNVDLLVAEAAVHQAETLARVSGAVAAAPDAAVAVMISARRVLPEIDHPWVDELRQRADRLSFRALELITRAHLELGDYAMAEADANRLIEANPFGETGYEVLMAVHIDRGSPARAIQVYEKCSAFLAEELGTSPGPAVREIFSKAAQLSSQGAGS